METNNPLTQYFRRPAVYLKLPSGNKGYKDTELDITPTGELPVYPMTAIDEITVRTPDALYNGTAVANLITSCVPNIKDPWAVKSNDLDAILIAIRTASNGESFDIKTSCPKCEEDQELAINLMNLLLTLKPGDYSKEYEFNDLKIKFMPLVYKQLNEVSLAQIEIQNTFSNLDKIEKVDERNAAGKKSLEDITILTMSIISAAIEYIQTPTVKVEDKAFILDFLKNCDKTTFARIRDLNTEIKKESEIKPLQLKCPKCSHEYEQPVTLNATDFFG